MCQCRGGLIRCAALRGLLKVSKKLSQFFSVPLSICEPPHSIFMKLKTILTCGSFVLAANLTTLTFASIEKSHLKQPYDSPKHTEASPEKMQWFNDAKFGLFIHWGVYAVTAGYWSKDNTFESWQAGKDLYSPHDYGERLLHATDMPLREYRKIADLFDWSNFDAQEIIDLCHASGQRYIVITSKHHDGFAIWPSEASDWNIRDATPYGKKSGRDPLKELADACARTKTEGPFEVKLCFYYSHCADWWEKDAASFGYEPHPDPKADVFQNYLDRKVKPQLTELLTNYGEIGMIWFDVPRIITPTQAQELYDLVNELSPNTIVNGRLGRSIGNYHNCGDNGDVGVPVDFPWETGSSINHSFGYHSGDHEHKEPAWIINKLIETAAHGGNYLLNIGPKSDGSVAKEDFVALTEVGQWTKANGEAIFGTRRTPYIGESSVIHPWGTCTQNGGNLYLIVTHWPEDGEIVLPLLENKVEAVTLFDGDQRKKLSSKHGKDANGNKTLVIDASKVTPHEIATVIKIETADSSIQLAPFKHAYDADAQTISLEAANFQAFATTVKSLNLIYDREQKTVSNWRYNKGNGATVAWTFDVPESGEYAVELDYGSIRRATGIPVKVLVNGEEAFEYSIANNKGWDTYEAVKVGTVNLTKGTQDLALDLRRSQISSIYTMQLRNVTLTKVN